MKTKSLLLIIGGVIVLLILLVLSFGDFSFSVSRSGDQSSSSDGTSNVGARAPVTATAEPTPLLSNQTITFAGTGGRPLGEITMPTLWGKSDQGPPAGMDLAIINTVRDPFLGGQTYGSNIQISLGTHVGGATTVADYQTIGLQLLQQRFPSLTFSTPALTKVGVYDAVTLAGSGLISEYPGVTFHVVAYIVYIDSQYAMSAVGITVEDGWQRDEAAIRAAVESFQIRQ